MKRDMMKIGQFLILGILMLGVVLGAIPSMAAETSPSDDEIVIANLDESLPENEMDINRGAADTTQISNQTLAATTTGNMITVAGDLTTGAITIGDTFGHGFGSYIMNTGNNTAINSAVALNVQVFSAP